MLTEKSGLGQYSIPQMKFRWSIPSKRGARQENVTPRRNESLPLTADDRKVLALDAAHQYKPSNCFHIAGIILV